MADYKVVDTEKLESELTGMADEVRTLADTDSKMSLNAMTDNVAQANEKVDSQSEIIAQIKTALQGKAGSGGGGDLSEIEQLIDESGVLDSTEGTATEKVEQLIHATDLFFKLYEVSFYGIHSVERIDFYIDWAKAINFQYARGLKYLKGIDVSKLITCRNMLCACNLLETIKIPFDMSTKNAYHMEGMFRECSSLVNVGFVAETIKESIVFAHSPLLSAESIQSIAYGLAYVTTTQTLTLPKVFENDFVRLTAELRDLINTKGWTLAFA